MGWKKVERERQWERPSAMNHRDMGGGPGRGGGHGAWDSP